MLWVFNLLFFAALAGPTPRERLERCYAEVTQSLRSSALLRPLDQEEAARPLSWERVEPELRLKLQRLSVDLCLELDPDPALLGRRRFPDLSGLLEEDLNEWSEKTPRPSQSPSLLFLRVLLRADRARAAKLLPLFIDAHRQFLLRALSRFDLEPFETQQLSAALSRPFPRVEILDPRGDGVRCFVDQERAFRINCDVFSVEHLLLLLVHEAFHQGRAPQEPMDWVELSLREEFRASYWAEVYRRAWLGPPSRPDLQEFFQAFRKHLPPIVHPDQERALGQFFVDYDALKPQAREKLLGTWIVGPSSP